MAEALAVVGLVSAIVQFVDFSSKVVKRLDDYRQSGNKVPKTFQKIHVQLPLITDSLKSTKQQAEAGDVSGETAKAVKAVVELCLSQVQQLEEILAKALPSDKESTWSRRAKAFNSLSRGKKIEEIALELDSHVQFLTYRHAAGIPFYSTRAAIPAVPQLGGSHSVTSRTGIHQSRLSGSSVGNQHEPCFMVNYPKKENFVGREDIMTEIDRRFAERQHRVTMAGMGGVGKSQIAIEYCYRYRETHPEAHIFWIHASNQARLVAAYQEMAKHLALPGADDPDVNTVQLVVDWLNNDANAQWLFILDNVDDMEISFGPDSDEQPEIRLTKQLPKNSRGAMIVTTRDRRIGERLAKHEKPIHVMPCGTEDARCLLKVTLCEDRTDDEQSTALLKALDFLPLAIIQAASFMRENCVSVKEYLNAFQANSKDAMDLLAEPFYNPDRDLERRDSVFQTWKISFERIRKQNPRAAEVLSLMAMLDRQAIPINLLQGEGERIIDFTKAVGILKAFSLITEEKGGTAFGLHRLVQLATQTWLELEKTSEEWQSKALAVVHNWCEREKSHPQTSDIINPHIQAVLGYVYSAEPCLVQRAVILNIASWYDERKGNYADAHSKTKEAYELVEKILEEDDNRRMQITYTLGVTLVLLAKHDTAEPLLRQLLEKQETVLGPNHPDTLVTMERLAHVMVRQTKYRAAETLHQEALSRIEKAHGLTAPQTLRYISNLASLQIAWGRYDVAEAMGLRALNGFEREYGPDYLGTLHAAHELSCILFHQGRYDAAEAMSRRALDSLQKRTVPELSFSLNILDTLAQILEAQGRNDEAEVLARQAFNGREKGLGLAHPSTLLCLGDLGSILGKQGRYEAAEAMSQTALDGLDRILGPDHPCSSIVLSKLGCVLSSQGKYEAAEKAHQRALAANEKILGAEHPNTLSSASSLASVLYKRKEFDQASVLYERACAGFQRTLGSDHHLTLGCVRDFATLQRNHPEFSIRFPARLQNLSEHISNLTVLHSQRTRKRSRKQPFL